ncbi:hypothetical protein SAMN06265338_1422 [Rhodoblastus acidophilus]|uniref:Uncharacterized protein n=1 Tax=Rhodoblastus acidophilus TaxID=1074 RepID=A0A212SGW6_RHOAC|nr:hypothetical protein [Rhodoblastus acidophilus]PPQ34733.1 hypothetical protein CKO16_22090 [Rhodoblastus acidophilus]SNB84972.1 hypothetical protein SAMN06265338_1422 [Rhodoblastus acidophilus]
MRKPEDRYDDTTPQELVFLARNLAKDPTLQSVFSRVGLHKNFERNTEHALLIARRQLLAPELETRPCASTNLAVAQALARRIFCGTIKNEDEAVAFAADRIRHRADEAVEWSRLFISEIMDIMRNLLESSFFIKFNEYKADKRNVIDNNIDVYVELTTFIAEQSYTYGLGGRGWTQIRSIIMPFLRKYWFDEIPDLSEQTVQRILASPDEYQIFRPGFEPRKD